MLAHLEHLDLTTLLEDLNWLHVELLDRLDGHVLGSILVSCKHNHSELTLAKLLAHFVVVKQVGKADGAHQLLRPILLLLLAIEVQNARLARRKDDLDRIQSPIGLWTYLILNLLHKRAGKAMHHAALQILLAPIAEHLVAIQDGPMFFEAISLGLQIALTLKEDSFLAFAVGGTKALMDLALFILKVGR